MKKIVSLWLSAALLFSLAAVLVSASMGTTKSDAKRVITDELMQKIMARSNEEIPVNIWLEPIDADAVENAALQETGLNREKIRELVERGEDDTLTSEAVDAYIAAERRIYAEKQLQANQAFLASYPAAASANGERSLFVSEFAPLISTSMAGSAILQMAEDAQIECISYAPPVEMENEMAISLPLIGADYVRDTSKYTGKGVKIGQYESGVPDLTRGTLPSNRITIAPGNWITTDKAIDHATNVAEVMVSSGHGVASYSHRGVAPDAELYCIGGSSNDLAASFYGGIEWLLKQGVHIINMSAKVYYNGEAVGEMREGEYTEFEKWTDHIAITHSVHFVKSSGNNGRGSEFTSDDKSVTHPGLAYNIITVGAIDDDDTLIAESDGIRWHELAPFSSFMECSGVPNKPDIVAPGLAIQTSSLAAKGSAFSGTSAAAPHVTGIVAQLLEQRPALKTLQDTVKAILTASISHPYLRYDSSDTNGFDRMGAGLVNARSASYTTRLYNFSNSGFDANCAAGTTKTFTFTVTSSDTMKRISLAWLLNVQISGSDHSNATPIAGTIPNLDLEILDPHGNVVASVSSAVNNLDVVELDAPAVGTYTIRVICRKASNKKMYFSVAWW